MSSTTEHKRKRGLLIVVEGLDRSGKTTQCELLQSRIKSHLLQSSQQQQSPPSISSTTTSATTARTANNQVRYQKFPDRTTPTGQTINTYLQAPTATTTATSSSGNSSSNNNSTTLSDQAIHLLFSANRWEIIPSIISDINAGITVIVDRYSFSGVVYSVAKDTPGLGWDWAWAPEVGLPAPDVLVFLDVEEKVQVLRGGFGGERYERVEMQRRVREGFGELFGRLKGSGVVVDRVDAGRGVDEVGEEVWRVYLDGVARVFDTGGDQELGVLGRLD